MTIDTFTIEEHTESISAFIPVGDAYDAAAVENTNLRRYITASSEEFKRIQDLMSTFLADLDPNITELFISEWESALGIPDHCIPIATTDEERRENIVLKLTSLSVQTEQDFIDLAAKFGFTITFIRTSALPYTLPFTLPVTTEIQALPFTLPFTLGPTEIGAFSWIIEGDFTSDPDKAAIFKCLVILLSVVGYQVIFVDT